MFPWSEHRVEDNYDDSCTSQQSEQGAEHHLVGVYEAVKGVAPLHVTNWSSSMNCSIGISYVNQTDWDDKTLVIGSAAYGNGSRNCCLGVQSTDGVL